MNHSQDNTGITHAVYWIIDLSLSALTYVRILYMYTHTYKWTYARTYVCMYVQYVCEGVYCSTYIL